MGGRRGLRGKVAESAYTRRLRLRWLWLLRLLALTITKIAIEGAVHGGARWRGVRERVELVKVPLLVRSSDGALERPAGDTSSGVKADAAQMLCRACAVLCPTDSRQARVVEGEGDRTGTAML